MDRTGRPGAGAGRWCGGYWLDCGVWACGPVPPGGGVVRPSRHTVISRPQTKDRRSRSSSLTLLLRLNRRHRHGRLFVFDRRRLRAIIRQAHKGTNRRGVAPIHPHRACIARDTDRTAKKMLTCDLRPTTNTNRPGQPQQQEGRQIHATRPPPATAASEGRGRAHAARAQHHKGPAPAAGRQAGTMGKDAITVRTTTTIYLASFLSCCFLHA